MKILSNLHGYPPEHNAGAEHMLHRIHLYMKSRGHEVRVLVPGIRTKTYEGVSVVQQGESPNREHWEWCDIVLSHLDMTGRALNVTRHFDKPFVFMVHNAHDYGIVRIRPADTYVVYNAHWVEHYLSKTPSGVYPQPSIVCHPHVYVKDFAPPMMTKYTAKKDGAVTLINLWEHKGGKVFTEIAKRMPNHKFIGVKGSYGKQETPVLPNVEYVEHTSNIKEVYDRTRLVLMPSKTESYGLVGLEAMASRIPVIATDTEGTREAMGTAGVFLEQQDIDSWVAEIKKFNNEEYYIEAAKRCAKRAKELDTTEDHERLEGFFKDIIEGKFIIRT